MDWIAFADKHPNNEQEVLVCSTAVGHCAVVLYIEGAWCTALTHDQPWVATHWMPLPELPK